MANSEKNKKAKHHFVEFIFFYFYCLYDSAFLIVVPLLYKGHYRWVFVADKVLLLRFKVGHFVIFIELAGWLSKNRRPRVKALR